ncbi:helix-turn-helix transcriptional regulator, partial [Klebsiella pneumoniae]
MRIEGLGLNNEEVLDRICEAYGFSQKIQLARHFEIASSSLANRYSRDSISYDFIVHCALETGANLAWLLTGKGSPTTGNMNTDTQNV